MSATPRPDDESGPSLTPALTPAFPHRAAWGTAPSLRAWQQAAMEKYFADLPRDFLAVATPGAGKTTFALSVASELLGKGALQREIDFSPPGGPKSPFLQQESAQSM